MNKHLTNDIMKEFFHERAKTEIQGIAKSWGVREIGIEFDSVKTFFITIPFNSTTKRSQAFHPDMLKDLLNNGYDISMIHADEIKGQRLYCVVKKQF